MLIVTIRFSQKNSRHPDFSSRSLEIPFYSNHFPQFFPFLTSSAPTNTYFSASIPPFIICTTIPHLPSELCPPVSKRSGKVRTLATGTDGGDLFAGTSVCTCCQSSSHSPAFLPTAKTFSAAHPSTHNKADTESADQSRYISSPCFCGG